MPIKAFGKKATSIATSYGGRRYHRLWTVGSQVSVLAEAMGMHVKYYDIETKLPQECSAL